MSSSCCDDRAADGFSEAPGCYQERPQSPEVLAVDFDVEKLLLIEIPTPRFYLSETLVPVPTELSPPPSLPPCEPYQPPCVLFPLGRSLVDVECKYANFEFVSRGCLLRRKFD
jgi:hypothetical protein